MSSKGRIALAEAIGTLILVVGGPGTAVLATGDFFPTGSVGVLGVALAFGLSLLCAAYAIGSISGCHINPAVTAGLWALGKTKTGDVPFYMGGQVVGGLVGARVIFVIAHSHTGLQRQRLRVRVERLRRALAGRFQAAGAVILTEVVFTGLFVFVIASTSRKSMSPGFTGVTVGLMLTRDPPHHDPGRQHLGEPGPQHRDRGVPTRLGAQAAVGVHRLPDRGWSARRPYVEGARPARRRVAASADTDDLRRDRAEQLDAVGVPAVAGQRTRDAVDARSP